MQLQVLPLILVFTLTPFNELDNLIGEEFSFLVPVLANQSNSENSTNLGTSTRDRTPGGNRTPGGTRPAGETHGTCPAKDKVATAIVPENARGLTLQDNPVFWFYLPYTDSEIHHLEFVLTDPDEFQTVYRYPITTFSQNTPALVAIALPQDNILESDRNYQWFLTINCTEKRREEENDITLDGWITKISPNDSVNSTTIWYDEVNRVINSYRENPNNLSIQNEWRQLLQSLGLEEFLHENIEQTPLNE